MPQLIPDPAEPANVKPIEPPVQRPMHYFIEHAAMRRCAFPNLLQAETDKAVEVAMKILLGKKKRLAIDAALDDIYLEISILILRSINTELQFDYYQFST